jgi:hypothetical protein
VLETVQQKIDPLVALQVADVHRYEAVGFDTEGEQRVSRLPIARGGSRGRQQRGVFYPADGFTRGMTLRYIFECRTHCENAETLPHRQRFEAAEGGEGKLEHRIRFNQLLRQGRIHVVHVRSSADTSHRCSNESAFLYGVDQVVLRTTHHPHALCEHEDVANHLLRGESGSNVSDPERSGDPMDAAVGYVDVFTFMERQHIHVMTARAEKFQHGLHRQGSPPGLKKGVGR